MRKALTVTAGVVAVLAAGYGVLVVGDERGWF